MLDRRSSRSTSRHTTAQKPNPVGRVNKSTRNGHSKSSHILKSSHKYFWYTSLKGLPRLALSLPNPTRLPVVQTNAYSFNPTKFARNRPPFALPFESFWPPKSAYDLLVSTDLEEHECIVSNSFHVATAHWQDHLDLRETVDRGLGIFTKSSFEKGDVLGWYAGEIVPFGADIQTEYVMQMPVGAPLSPPPSPCMSDVSSYSQSENKQLHTPSRSRSRSLVYDDAEAPQVWIDGNKSGNWTRFLNHSCTPHTGFQICRIGDIKVMAVRALRNIPNDVELTVNYGSDYYGKDTLRICHCGAARCVGKARHEK